MKYALELLSFLACALCVLSKYSAGPYHFRMISWDKCGQPSDAVYYDLKVNAVASGYSYTGRIKFDVPIDNTLAGMLTFEKRNNHRGWRSYGYVNVSKNFCDFIKDIAPGYFSALTNAIHTAQECPIPKGTYEVKQWEIDLKLPRFPSLYYGEYKIKVDYILDKRVIGCVKWHYEIDM